MFHVLGLLGVIGPIDHDTLQVYLAIGQLVATAIGVVIAAGFGLLVRITRNSFTSLQATVSAHAEKQAEDLTRIRERLARIEQACNLPASYRD